MFANLNIIYYPYRLMSRIKIGHRVRAEEFDKEATERLRKLIFFEENMKRLVDDINAATKSLRIDYGRKITELKNKASDIQRRIVRQYEAIEGGIIDASLVAPRLKELKNQKDALQEEISYYESLNSQNQAVYITRAMIDKFRKEMEQIFMGDNIQEKRDFLKKFIEKIIVKDEEIKIVYYAPKAKFPSSALPSV